MLWAGQAMNYLGFPRIRQVAEHGVNDAGIFYV